MKALVYHGPGKKAWEEVPDPTIQQPTDVIVRVDTTTICGTDLHILKGDVPAVTDGRILGHEGVGTVTEVGPAVSTLEVGDRVIISCISAVRRLLVLPPGPLRALPGRRGRLAASAGSSGTSSTAPRRSYVRVPFADNSLYKLPARRQPTRPPSCCPTSCPPASRSACATAGSSPATWSPSSAPDRSGSRR